MSELFTYMFNTDIRKYSVLTVANSVSTMETQQEKQAILLNNLPFFISALAQ
jgi:hypothetical protein